MCIFTRLLTVDDRTDALQARTRSFKSAVITNSIAPTHKHVSRIMRIFVGEHGGNGLPSGSTHGINNFDIVPNVSLLSRTRL